MKIINYYQEKESIYGISKERLKAVLEILGHIEGKKIIEFGCGNGILGKNLKARGAVVYGCDISKAAIEQSKKLIDKVFYFDIEKDDFEGLDGDFDVVIASEVIEHLFYPEKFLIKVKKILKEEGWLIITTPNFLMWSNRIKMLVGKFEYKESGFWDRGHIHFFTYYSLKKILQKYNFKIVAENNVPYRCPKYFAKVIPGWFVFQMIFKIKKWTL